MVIYHAFQLNKNAMQRSKRTFSKSRLLVTFNCKMVAMKKIQLPKREGHFVTFYTSREKTRRGRGTLHDVLHDRLKRRTARF